MYATHCITPVDEWIQIQAGHHRHAIAIRHLNGVSLPCDEKLHFADGSTLNADLVAL